MDPGPILFTEIQSTAILVLLFSANNHLPHNTVNPLLQQAGEIDNLTVSLGQSTLVVLCRFHVGAGIPGVAPHYISPPSTFNVLLGSYWFDKPWFLTEGKLAAVRITPSSWGSQRTRAVRVSMVMPSLYVNCPTVICSPNMLFILWERHL